MLLSSQDKAKSLFWNFFHFLCSNDHIFLFTKGVIACTSAWVTVVLGEFRVALGSSIGLDLFTSLLGSSIDLIFYIDTWLKY